MKRTTLLAMTLLVTALAAREVNAEPAAFLRTDGTRFYVAVKVDPPLWDGLEKSSPGTEPAKVLDLIQAALYQDGKQLSTAIEGTDGYGADFTVTIPDANTILRGDFKSLVLAVHQYPIAKGVYSGFIANVSTEVSGALTLRNGNCIQGFPLEVAINDKAMSREYALKRSKELLAAVRGMKPAVEVHIHSKEHKETWALNPHVGITGDENRFVPCYELEPEPSETYDVSFTFPPLGQVELRHPFIKTGVKVAVHGITPATLDSGNVGKRSLEQNLDTGVQFSSQVADEKTKDTNGKDLTVRRRKNVGTLDLRLAPWLNVLSVPDPGSSTFKFLTPLMIDARVSTGKITKDSLSLNRIVFGGEYEIRHYTNPGQYPSYQRYIISFKNASDRDFKQAEWKGGFEFQPVFSVLNRPLSFKGKTFSSEIDPDPKRGVETIPARTGFGGQLLPVVGFEMGKRWRNKSSLGAIEQTDFVRRFYFGATINLDLTSYVKLIAKDLLYVRGEAKQDRLHNYFLGSIEVPFPSFSTKASTTAFFSFERGGQPPFSTPDVNAVKIGYRIQFDGLGKRR